MAYGIKLLVWGNYACFSRPEMKVERVSYDIMTPSAARGILEAIYWKPSLKWVIDKIHVLSPISFTHVRRNEISCKISKAGYEKNPGIDVTANRQQRAAMILKDVQYGIEAHFEFLSDEDNNEAKHLDIFNRRAKKGQYYHHPYLGTREFFADFAFTEDIPECPEELNGEKDLGFMLHDIIFSPDDKGKIIDSNQGERLSAEPRFFRAVMKNGIIEVPPLNAKGVVS